MRFVSCIRHLMAVASLCFTTLGTARCLCGQVDVVELTAQDIAEGYASGAFTAVDVTEAFLNQIAKYEQNYNAFISFNPDVLATARALDEEFITVGLRGPLHGVPVVVKEAIDMAGLPSTAGYAAFSSQTGGVDLIPDNDALLVSRLKEAGAIILGKTNMAAFGLGGTRADLSWDGPTYNAHDRTIAPGGSSSGTATAVAASFAVLGMGQETGGSIQNPAGAQNLVGIKPTFGLVPTTGVTPISTTTLDVVGPLAKTVYDAAIALDAIAGFAPEEPRTEAAIGKLPAGGYTSKLSTTALEGKNIGLFGPGWMESGIRHETLTLYEEAMSVIAAQGATLVEAPFEGSQFLLKAPDHFRRLESVVYDFEKYLERLIPSDADNSIEELKAITGVDLFGPDAPFRWVEFLPVAKNSLQNPDAIPDLSDFMDARAEYLQEFTAVMESNNLDALVYPQMSAKTPPLNSDRPIDATTASEINILGIPGVIVPGGYYSDNSPFSLIFVGEHFSEADLLGYAFDFEQATMHRVAPHLRQSNPIFDFNNDDVVGVIDIDLLAGEIISATNNPTFDLSGDGKVDAADLSQWLLDAAFYNGFGDSPYLLGDANLDGLVGPLDLNILALSWQEDVGLWSDGNFTVDGSVDSSDLNALALNWRQSILMGSSDSPVPEPSAMFLMVFGLAFMGWFSQYGRRRCTRLIEWPAVV